MNIVLISPYTDITSFGLRSISAVLKEARHKTRLIFLPHMDRLSQLSSQTSAYYSYRRNVLDEITELCREADLIGISLMTECFNNVVAITKRIKEKTAAPIIWGGIHVSGQPRECLEYADMVCLGEGEATILDVVERMEQGNGYEDVDNIWLKRDGKVMTNPVRPLMQDLDHLPIVDYDLQDHFILDEGSVKQMNAALFKKYVSKIQFPGEKHPLPAYHFMTNRGCPHNCTFCCNSVYRKLYPGQKMLRMRDPQHVMHELITIKKRFDFFEAMVISDDTFFARSTAQIKEFAGLYKEAINLPMRCIASPLTITEEKMRPIVDATGKCIVEIGIQSGSARIKKMYRRERFTNGHVEKAAQIFSMFEGVLPEYDFILDNPYETEEDALESLRLIARLPRPHRLKLFSLTFFPGTELYEKAKGDGIITAQEGNTFAHLYEDCLPNYLNLLFRLYKYHLPLPILQVLSHRKVVHLVEKRCAKVVAVIFRIVRSTTMKYRRWREKYSIRPL